MIKKEIAAMQKRVIAVDHESKKQTTIYLQAKREYDTATEARDHVLEKKNILYTTFTTLKRDIHTRKQMHKMNILA